MVVPSIKLTYNRLISSRSTSSNEIWMVLRHHSDPLMPHQAASVPQIRICSIDPDQQDFPQISIYISGKNIAVTVENEFASEKDFEGGNFLYVFDWTTGDTKVVSQKSYNRNIKSKFEITGISFT